MIPNITIHLYPEQFQYAIPYLVGGISRQIDC